jgi:hypothetical protein
MQNATDLDYCNYVNSISKDVERSYTINAALQWLYSQSVLQDLQLCIQRSFLATLNAYADKLNDVVLQQLLGTAGK